MTRLIFDMTMSLDGFITDPNAGTEIPVGEDPGRLHDWMFATKTDEDAAIVAERYRAAGAILIGRRMFDVGFEPWGDPPPFGMPVFVLTNRPQPPIERQGGTTYTFVSDGLQAALEQAGAAAGDKAVGLWGGANIFRQYLAAGLIDELHIHIAPVVLGQGTPLFERLETDGIELEPIACVQTPGATHLRFGTRSSAARIER
jgi:dihydrofolate reductase